MDSGPKHTSIIQAEAAAACVGVILLAMVIVTIVVVIVILVMKNKMKENSVFVIHVSRNFSNSVREKESPVNDYGQPKSFVNPTADCYSKPVAAENYQTDVTTTSFEAHKKTIQDTAFQSPLPDTTKTGYDYDTSLATGTETQKEVFNKSTDSSVALLSLAMEEPIEKENGSSELVNEPVSVQTPPTALPRTTVPRRAPPTVPIIKPKPYAGPSEKPPVSAKPTKPKPSTRPEGEKPFAYPVGDIKQGTLTVEGQKGIECGEKMGSSKPELKPKPKVLPRKNM